MTNLASGESRRSIRFLLDGETIQLENVDPTRTVLQFLREDLGRTGTKEGCAEGDCGACTVALVEIAPETDRLQVRAVNSCIQFLPTLDGRELITVENLRGADGSLHPVQQAMVECHGSQCGFCTPGFVMSLFAHYKASDDVSRKTIDDVLAGNLCRCTGYQPIVDAASKIHELSSESDSDWLRQPNSLSQDATNAEQQRIAALQQLRSDTPLASDFGGKQFFSPRSAEQLAALLEQHPDATLLAGGTDVGLWVTKQHRELGVVIYTGNIEEMKSILVEDDHLDIGAAATLTSIMPVLDQYFPDLHDLFVRFASPPIRNAGTLGGNVANGSPIGDSMPVLLSLDATLLLRKGSDQRSIALQDFYLDYQKTALKSGEFVERIRIPYLSERHSLRSYKISKRFDQDISAVCGAFCVELDGDTVRDIRIAFGGVAAIPKRALETENSLRGAKWDSESIASAVKHLEEEIRPISDMRATADYRLKVCGSLLQRFFIETTDDSVNTDVYSYGR